MIVSKSDYAESRGLSRSAISKLISRGTLSGGAIVDGRIDTSIADAQLARRAEPIRSASAKARVTTAPRAANAGGDAGWAGPREAAANQLLRARALSASIAAERARRELMAERGRYTLAAEAEAAWAKGLSAFLLEVEQSLNDLAMTLGLDAAGRVALRRWWRNRRVAAAETNRLAAAAAPEFVEDTAA